MIGFIETIKERNRMCDKYLIADRICSNCPLHTRNNGIYKTCTDIIFENPEVAYKIINEWSKANKGV